MLAKVDHDPLPLRPNTLIWTYACIQPKQKPSASNPALLELSRLDEVGNSFFCKVVEFCVSHETDIPYMEETSIMYGCALISLIILAENAIFN
jgi:hypothetical protein